MAETWYGGYVRQNGTIRTATLRSHPQENPTLALPRIDFRARLGYTACTATVVNVRQTQTRTPRGRAQARDGAASDPDRRRQLAAAAEALLSDYAAGGDRIIMAR